MASAISASSSLTDAERNMHNFKYLVQFVLSQENPAIAACGVLSLIVAISKMLESRQRDAFSVIYAQLYSTVRDRYLPDYRVDEKGKPAPGPVKRSTQTHDEQRDIPWVEGGFIPHYCCLECGYAAGRGYTTIRHVGKVHPEKCHGKTKENIRDDHVDVFLAYWSNASGSKEEWLRLLKTQDGSLPLLLGKRDIAPIASELKAAMDEIVANPVRVIPLAHEVLSPAPPPLSTDVSTDVPPPVAPAANPSPPAAPITSRALGKRKAGEDYNDMGHIEQIKRRRAARLGADTSDGASSSRTISVAATNNAAPPSTAPNTFAGLVFSPNPPLLPLPAGYDVPIDPALLNSAHTWAARDPEYPFPGYNWELNILNLDLALRPAGPRETFPRLSGVIQSAETPHTAQGSSRDRSTSVLSAVSGDGSSTAFDESNINPGQSGTEENAAGEFDWWYLGDQDPLKWMDTFRGTGFPE